MEGATCNAMGCSPPAENDPAQMSWLDDRLPPVNLHGRLERNAPPGLLPTDAGRALDGGGGGAGNLM